jgi:DNA-binding transcriptional MerR regulator/DNA gyrase inhibitor GyrI
MSKLCNIPIRTLHYYNDIGLLVPDRVDPSTGYRYYSHAQLSQVNAIKHFKSAGFSLKEVQVLMQRSDLALNREMIRGKCEEITREIRTLNILKNRLQLYVLGKDEAAPAITTEIRVQELPVSYVAYSRYKGLSSHDEFGLRYTTLTKLVEQNNLLLSGTMMAIYYDDYRTFDYQNADIEVCVAVAAQSELPGVVRQFGGFLAVTATHYGSYQTMPQTYGRMLDWVAQNGFEYTGAAVENYIIDIVTTGCEDNYVTELILPVKKL